MLFLKNATYLDYRTFEVIKTSIRITEGAEGRIEFIAADEIPVKANVLDCTGLLVTKSFACGHHHAYSALAAGMPAPKKTPQNFLQILEYIWWKLDKCLDRDMIETSALLTAMACVRNGATFAIDHHSSPFAVEGSLEVIAGAFDKVGLSHLLCYEITDRDGNDIAQKGLQETKSYLQKRQGLVGLHAGFTVDDEMMKKAVALAQHYNCGIHIHVAEDLADENISLQRYGKRVVERLNDAGVLDFSPTILAHCLHLDAGERSLVRNSKAWVVQNTESNINNKVGSFTSRDLGDRIMLGTDGMHSDMIRAAKAAYQENRDADPLDPTGIYGRFRKVHEYISANGFTGDGVNNLVVLETTGDFEKVEFPEYFVGQMNSSQIRHVIANGKLVVMNRKNTTVDEDEILKNAEVLTKELWRRMAE